jgi:hypothetical protein
MESLDIKEILAGICSLDYQSHRSTLLQLLANKCSESENLDNTQTIEVVDVCLKLLCYFSSSGNRDSNTIDLLCSVLSNLTTHEHNSQLFVDSVIQSETSGNYENLRRQLFIALVEIFLSYNPHVEETVTKAYNSNEDCYKYFSYLLCNITRHTDGQRIFLSQSSGYMVKLVLQVSISTSCI